MSVPNAEGLRPTPDRIRETLFNWLQVEMPSAQVLDCFAGAGGLGFEAASREAGSVVMVEQDVKVTQHLQQQAERLRAENIQVVHADIRHWLPTWTQAFDVVFIDPPYAQAELRA